MTSPSLNLVIRLLKQASRIDLSTDIVSEDACKDLAEKCQLELNHLSAKVAEADKYLAAIDGIRKEHESIARHNEGVRGMPQGPCQCAICSVSAALTKGGAQ